MRNLAYAFLLGALALAGCGDPQTSAQNAMAKAEKALQQAQGNLDPQKRLAVYSQILEDLQNIAKKYPKTATGGALAAGQSVDGLSIGELMRKHDDLAARAKCYANPTADCLRPFGSSAVNGSGDAAQSSFAAAEDLVCSKGFSAADKSLDSLKINKPAYAKELVQVALAAAKCNKPGEVQAAIGAYMPALDGAERTDELLSVLATPDLRPAWSQVTDDLEKGLSSGAIAGQDAASATLTLAVDYARAGNVKAALDKYAYFTNTLHYQADSQTQSQLAMELIADGAIDDGLKITEYSNDPNVVAATLHQGVGTLGNRLGLVDAPPASPPRVYNVKSIDDYMAPVDADLKAQSEVGANALEARIDALASNASPSAQTIGGIGFDADYGILALVRQKLGESDKASADIKKAIDYRTRILGRVDNGADYNQFAPFPALVAIVQGDLPAAANYVKTAQLFTDTYAHFLMVKVGETQNAEQALAIASTVSGQRDLWHSYSDMIPEMAKAGKIDQVEKLIGAYSGDPRQKADFYSGAIEGLVAKGDVDAAKKYADKQGLAKDDAGKLRLDSELLSSDKIAGNRGKAEPIIREMFAIGETHDEAVGADTERYASSYSSDRYTAQNAAAAAFKNGYTDLGIELYQKAANKDQRPLLAAFSGNVKKSDITKLLMLAQDHASGDELSYVIDRAVSALEKKQS